MRLQEFSPSPLGQTAVSGNFTFLDILSDPGVIDVLRRSIWVMAVSSVCGNCSHFTGMW